MNFQSPGYGIFLALVALGAWCVFWRRGHRNTLLLCASYLFYAQFDWRYLALIGFSTVLDYRVGRVLVESQTPWVRRAALTVSVVLNLGLLGFFKCFGWTLSFVSRVPGLEGLGSSAGDTGFQMPVGISFYTFQTLSYSIDLYRAKVRPARNLADFALFVAFFPQLIAGPIVRASEFLPQLERRRVLSRTLLSEGLYRIACGLAKKVLVADFMYSATLAPYFADIEAHTLAAHWIFAIAGIVRMYYDFSGYCDIAVGSAKVLGFDLPENFRLPFRALTVREFWQRWHITLYTWLRDYLFEPLVGGRLVEPRVTIGLFLTTVLIGVWHGAALSFLVYGILHGLAVAIEWRFQLWYRKRYRRAFASTPLRRVCLWIYTTQFVALTSICIHSADFGRILAAVVEGRGERGLASITTSGWLVLALAVSLHFLPQAVYHRARATFLALPVIAAGACLGVTIGAAWYLRLGDVPFIYFQF